MISLLSLTSLVGFVWSIAVFWLLYTDRGVQVSSSKWFLLVTFPAACIAVPIVSAQVDAITLLAGGVQTLDGHVGYGAAHITEFAEALGKAGREEYAYFQLGLDTLAPPAFAGFVLNVGRSTVPFVKVRTLLTVIVGVYFISVLFANALMPVYMLNYPDQGLTSSLLYTLLPLLDGIKYGTHALAWLVILCSAMASGVAWIQSKRNS